MIRNLLILALAVTGAVACEAAEMQGVLIDRNCSYNVEPRVVPGPRLEGGMMQAYVHTRACALKPESQKSGYGIFTYDQKFVPFDAAGNRKALELLRATKKEDDLRIVARGELQEDGSLKVSGLQLLN